MEKIPFYQFTYHEFEKIFLDKNLSSANAKVIYNWFYHLKRKGPVHKHMGKTSISQESVDFINKTFDFSLPKISKIKNASDRTVKLLFELYDGSKVESVIIPFNKKYTVCISSQVGCAMKCSFCYTGTQGLKRHLKTYEIVGQYMAAKHWLNENRPDDNRILNIVFMGQGEPLHNFDAVKKAASCFLDNRGISMAKEKITISTAGYLPGLVRWNKEMPNVNLALSLHSPVKEKRDELIPINKKYPLEEVLNVIDSFPMENKRWITYEYLMIKDFNDSIEDAKLIGRLFKNRPALINLIPFNPFPGSHYQRPDINSMDNFKNVLVHQNIHTMIRTTKGDEILAACGQLNTK